MAEELVRTERKRLGDRIERSDVFLTKEQAEKIGKRKGRYVTVSSDAVMTGEQALYDRLAAAISDALRDMLGRADSVLVAGLGNAAMTADALGVKVAQALSPQKGLYLLSPSVFGVTGIESFEVVKGVVDRLKPSAVIAVDTLCAASKERLGTAFQLTDGGITPGSGVSNARRCLCRESLGTTVISIGVPLVIHASAYSGKAEGELIVTPKDVDFIVSDAALVIASAIRKAL